MAEQTKIMDEINKKIYNKLQDVPFKVMYAKPILVDDSIYFFPNYMHKEVKYLNNFCNNRYVKLQDFSPECYKYDPTKDSFEIFTKIPDSVTSLYGTLNYNKSKKEFIYVGGTHDVFAKISLNQIKNGKNEEKQQEQLGWDLQGNFEGIYETTGPLPSSIYINDTFHMIGGHNSYYHEIYNDKQKRMKPVYKFEYRLKDRALVYRKKSNELIMFGGCKWNEDFKQNVRFRYIDQFLICKNPNNVKDIKWEEKKDWKLPYAMIGFGYFLLNDSKLFIFGGRKSGGDHSNQCWMLDMETNLWSLSSIKIPKPGKYHAILCENKMNVQLFEFGHPTEANQSHFNIPLNVLIESMKIAEELPIKKPTIIYKEYDSQKRIYCINKLKGGRMSLNELANEVVNNKDLSKNMRKKMAKKLRKKQQKLKNFNNNNNNNNRNNKYNPSVYGKNDNNNNNNNNFKVKVGVISVIAVALIFYYRNQKKRISQ